MSLHTITIPAVSMEQLIMVKEVKFCNVNLPINTKL